MQRAKILEEIEVKKPRLVLVEFPCSKWSSLSKFNYHRPSKPLGREKLKKLREKEKPLVDFTEKVASLQIPRGDDILAENPENSDARELPSIKRLEASGSLSFVIGDQCRHGLVDRPVSPLESVHGGFLPLQKFWKNLAVSAERTTSMVNLKAAIRRHSATQRSWPRRS